MTETPIEQPLHIEYGIRIKTKKTSCELALRISGANSLWAAATHAAYLEKGADIGLTVGSYRIAYVLP